MLAQSKNNSNKPTQSEGESNLSEHRLEWANKTTSNTTKDLLARDAAAFVDQSVSSPCLSTITKAEGPHIWDGEGRKYLGFHGNNVHHIGYGHPRLKKVISDQMDKLPFAPRRFTCTPAVELAEKLGDIALGKLNKVLYTTSGLDAVEGAMKIARAATGRFKTISFWNAFHGAGFGASSIGGEQLLRSNIVGPFRTSMDKPTLSAVNWPVPICCAMFWSSKAMSLPL